MGSKIESGLQLLSRLNSSSAFSLSDIHPELFKSGSPSANEIIELTGDCCSGILLDLLVRVLVPKNLNFELKIGVVLVNTSHMFNILDIAQTIDSHLKNCKVEKRKPLVEKALSNLTILNCFGLEEMELTLRGLDRIIQESENVNLVIIDDLTSQFWMFRSINPRLSFEQFTKNLFQTVQTAVKHLNILLIFSRQPVGLVENTIDLNVDYKIIANKNDTTIFDYVNKTTKILKLP